MFAMKFQSAERIQENSGAQQRNTQDIDLEATAIVQYEKSTPSR